MAKKASRKATTKKVAAKKKATQAARKGASKKTSVARTGAAEPSPRRAKSGTLDAAKPKAAPKGRPVEIGIQSQHVDFLTYKVEQIRKFYDDLLGLKTGTVDHDGLNYLTVRTSSSSSLGFMPPHPDMTGEAPLPREPTLYFVVKDVDKAYSQLMAKGVAFMGPPEEMPWGHRVVTTTDPEGRTVVLASNIGKKK